MATPCVQTCARRQYEATRARLLDMTAQRAAVDDEMQSLLSRKLLRVTASAGVMRRELAAVASHAQLRDTVRTGAEAREAAKELGTRAGSDSSGEAGETVAEILRLLGRCDAEFEKVMAASPANTDERARSLAAQSRRSRAWSQTHKARHAARLVRRRSRRRRLSVRPWPVGRCRPCAHTLPLSIRGMRDSS